MMHTKKTHYLVIAVMSFFIASCGKKPTTNTTLLSPSKRNALIAQGKYQDLPVPVGCMLIEEQSEHQTTFLHYVGKISFDYAITFYMHEMERSGWDIVNLSQDHKGMLVCSKPTKNCVVSLTTQKADRVSIKVFIKSVMGDR